MGNKSTGLGAFLSATGFGLPIGLPLLAKGISEGGLKPHVPDIKPPGTKEIDESAAQAKERERRRLASGSRSTVLSRGRAEALSGSIGKRLLGGTQ